VSLADVRKLGCAPSEGNQLDDEESEDADHAQPQGVWLVGKSELNGGELAEERRQRT
jgi:hypothetical protein